jgi:hypothetical protein
VRVSPGLFGTNTALLDAIPISSFSDYAQNLHVCMTISMKAPIAVRFNASTIPATKNKITKAQFGMKTPLLALKEIISLLARNC